MAKKWGTIFSQTAIALSAGVMSPHQNLLEQTHISMLVARVPKAPFFTLILLNLIYAMAGIVLAFFALCSKPKSAREVQARLSLASLVAACFESRERNEMPSEKVEELFAERNGRSPSQKVGVVVTERGGWRYVSGADI
jgi:hypothetical protein